jgi:ankyrin repeat protein
MLGGTGTPLHNAAKEKNKKAVRFLLENGAFLPPDMTDGHFNPPLHYCPGLEWAYKLRNKLLVDAAKQQ